MSKRAYEEGDGGGRHRQRKRERWRDGQTAETVYSPECLCAVEREGREALQRHRHHAHARVYGSTTKNIQKKKR